jgi:RNA polymerase sigma-70 factor (ECF subfamily)
MEPGDDIILGLLATDLNEYYVLLWQKYVDSLYAYIFRHTKSLPDTEDIMQDIALRTYHALSGYSEEKIRGMAAWLRPWLYKVAKSAYLTYIEKHKHLVTVSLSTAEDTFLDEMQGAQSEWPEQILENKERRHELESLVAALPEKYCEVVYLHYFEGFKLYEIADILQEPGGTVRQKERRALALLRKAMSGVKGEVQ